jgi:uncharacterized membrane protein YqjE
MENEINVVPDDSGRTAAHTTGAAGHDASLGELFKQLAQDSTVLVKQEVALAKAEMRENLKSMGKDVAFLAMGGAILLVGVLVLTAFLVALLGDALDNYWLGALIVGLIYAIVGAVLLMKGKNNLQHDDLKPEQTIATLKEDKRWAESEIQQVKRGLSS